MALSIPDLALIFAASVAPPYLYILWLRNAEICDRESLSSIHQAFTVGAVFSLGLAFILETLIVTYFLGDGSILPRPFWILDPDIQLIVLACVIAPLVEEGTKGLGVLFFKNKFTELENGFVYGAAIGLGFAAFENILYEANAYSIGLSIFIGTAIARALTSTALHASSTSILGFGIVRHGFIQKDGRPANVLPYYLIAVGMHSLFNLLAIIGTIMNSELLALIGLVAGLVLVQQTLRWIRKRIEELDREQGCGPYYHA
ncbi:MAG: hypothetical protein A4E32_01092 [Methanomassiliicoccales archaeon PtaU1.Bin124]|nr:MAG: hypothetical protein A4E32_01092 [Methanomassiliicoccales archaeon PtaU1.Bin124]